MSEGDGNLEFRRVEYFPSAKYAWTDVIRSRRLRIDYIITRVSDV